MAYNTYRGKIFDCIGVGAGVAAMIMLAGATFGGNYRNSTEIKGSIHQITFPVIGSTSDGECAQEAASYATAVVNLQVAQQAADAAYVAWYRCEHGTDPGIPDPPEDPQIEHALAQSTHSILER